MKIKRKDGGKNASTKLSAGKRLRRRKCKCCGAWFMPQPQNASHKGKRHQKHCTKPACRKASKYKSHRRWRRKNRDYYLGDSLRTQNWRKENPGYRRRNRRVQHAVIRLRAAKVRGKLKVFAQSLISKTGVLQDFSFKQPASRQRFKMNLDFRLPDFIKISRAA